MGLDLAAARLNSTCCRSRDDMRGLRSKIGDLARGLVARHGRYGRSGIHSWTSLSLQLITPTTDSVIPLSLVLQVVGTGLMHRALEAGNLTYAR
jgi:hypothetical protein